MLLAFSGYWPMSFRSPALTFKGFRLNLLAVPRHVTHRASAAKRRGKLGERGVASGGAETGTATLRTELP